MTYCFIQSDATRIPLADQSVDLTFTSPPYLMARTYGIGAGRAVDAWIDWMLEVVRECLRVTKGAVIINCAGQTRDRNYQPGPEGLLYRAWQSGIHSYRPCYWHRVGIPGSGGDQWYRADVEYILCFKREGKLPHAEPKENGHAPKWAPGGEMSYRQSSGTRRNAWGQSPNQIIQNRTSTGERDTRKRAGRTESVRLDMHKMISRRDKSGERQSNRLMMQPNGVVEARAYTAPAKANPGNVLKVKVGGGLLGHRLAHENEAPFPIKLPEFFIRSHCPPGGVVLDPFCGSGSTAHAAYNLGRNAIGCDLRMSQCELSTRRMKDVMCQHGLFNKVVA